MAGKILRGAVVGASTLLGKEIAEELSQSTVATWDISLLDAAESGGQITAAGDEALVVQPISAEAFIGVDVAFFTEAATAKEYWQLAHTAGASIVDLSGALEGMLQVLVRSPWVLQGNTPDLATVAVVAAHPVAVMLALAAQRLAPFDVKRMAATVLQPASEMGSAGVDELHQQTVGLLSFQTLNRDIYDAQVAFNLRSALGGTAKTDLLKTTTEIIRQIATIEGTEMASLVTVQLLQAPVFHGYTASVYVELGVAVEIEQVSRALRGGVLVIASDDELSPSNEAVAGKGEVQVSVQAAGAEQRAFWLWMAADNLRLMAGNAAACGVELAALRPVAGVN